MATRGNFSADDENATQELGTVHTGSESPAVSQTSLGGQRAKIRRREGEAVEKGLSAGREAQATVLGLVDSELKVMTGLLKLIQSKKTGLSQMLCGYTGQGAYYEPRNILDLNVSQRVASHIVKSTKTPLHLIQAGIRKAADGIKCPSRTKTTESQLEKMKEVSYYDKQLGNILSELNGVSLSEVPETVQELARMDFAGHGFNRKCMFIFTSFHYDFPLANPLLLLASRWNFTLHEAKIVSYIDKQRKKWQTNSKTRFDDYRKRFKEWEASNEPSKIQYSECSESPYKSLSEEMDTHGPETAKDFIPDIFKSIPKLPSRKYCVKVYIDYSERTHCEAPAFTAKLLHGSRGD
eukprot:TRINITY_DN3822_c0_g1_i6.p1 TRINITY_DN3822_c0_g1~~TRINITY_DN3822_c0_g1_i6.p1  ORF type:complete len:351 (-),score=36.24 TRINITY_DN3822_c0_g1_i6:885-1937(-)